MEVRAFCAKVDRVSPFEPFRVTSTSPRRSLIAGPTAGPGQATFSFPDPHERFVAMRRNKFVGRSMAAPVYRVGYTCIEIARA